MKKRRAPGTGTVAPHKGMLRLRMPPDLGGKWVKKQFPLEQRELANLYLDDVVRRGRARRAQLDSSDGASLALLWSRYVAKTATDIGRRRGMRAGHKTRARLDGMGENWLSQAPFWTTDLQVVQPTQVFEWLRHVQLMGENAKGEPVSDSWVNQMASSIRAVYQMMGLDCPAFRVKTDRRLAVALNLEKQRRFFSAIEAPRDQVMAGCQMGAGLRLWELLSLTVDRVDLGDAPHLLVTTGGPDGAPTKSGRHRRVELVEPGLGFFRLAMRHHWIPNDRGLLFAGPQGGYLSAWPEKFRGWSEAMGERVTSHTMRHSWAYSMLSGSWGYAPQDITFVSIQLGHADIKTTQEAYGHWDPGAGLSTARRLRGEAPDRDGKIITAEWLLRQESGALRSSLPASKTRSESAVWVSDGNSSNSQERPAFLDRESYRVAHEAARDLTRAVREGRPGLEEAEKALLSLGDDLRVLSPLLALRTGDPSALRQTADLLREVLAAKPAVSLEIDDEKERSA